MSAPRLETGLVGPRDSMTSATSAKLSPPVSPRRGAGGTPKWEWTRIANCWMYLPIIVGVSLFKKWNNNNRNPLIFPFFSISGVNWWRATFCCSTTHPPPFRLASLVLHRHAYDSMMLSTLKTVAVCCDCHSKILSPFHLTCPIVFVRTSPSPPLPPLPLPPLTFSPSPCLIHRLATKLWAGTYSTSWFSISTC